MDELSYTEISDWRVFEDLVADYFREVKQDNEYNVDSVEVRQTGKGSDGGRDIVVTLTLDDSVLPFKRIWVIQCKFHESEIGKSELSDVNIPTLIHEYKANGYLLVCKSDVGARLTESFERLNDNCKFGFKYHYWNGNNLLSRIRFKDKLIEHYFPKHAEYLKSKEKIADEIK